MEETVQCVRALLNKDHRYTVTDLQREMLLCFSHEASRGTIYTVLTEQLEMSKVCACWVPRQLTDEHRKNQLASTLQFLTQYNEQGNDLIERIVTGDETWVHFWTPEMKEQSRVWKTKGEETPKKFKQVPSVGKVLLTTFWDCCGLIYAKFATDKQRIN